MANAKSTTPALRFKGFDAEWEERQLGDIAEKVTRTDPSSTAPVMMITADNGFIKQSDRYAFNNSGQSLTKYIVLKRKELAYNHGASKLRPYGSCFALPYKEARVPFVYHCFSIDNDSPDFISIQLNGTAVEAELRKIVSSGARMDGLLNISYEAYSKVPISLPNPDEQGVVANYFNHLDNLITLQRRKLVKLQNVKKAMLQKMFPTRGSTTPQIRFAGFTEPWQEQKLGDLAAQTYGGGTPATANEKYWGGDIPWIQSSDLTENKLSGVVPRKYVTNAGLRASATRLVPKNSIAIITRVGVGKLAIMPFAYTTSQDFLSLSNLKANAQFSAYVIYNRLQSELHAVQGTSIKGITKEELLAKELLLPDEKEQIKIGIYFKQLDTRISLQQLKLEKLQNVKKACLAAMFV